jgi:uncharacterized protein (TIGR03435 family)
MSRATIRTALLVFAWSLAHSQTFDAASLKPAAPPSPDGRGMIILNAAPSGGPGTKDPGRIHYPFTTLKNVLMDAYNVKNFQITGPAWLDTERFDITATMAPTTTKEQFRAMLQNLLAERFKMMVHREAKELPMYSLVVAKNGPKLKESAIVAAPKDVGEPAQLPPPPMQPKIGQDGFPILPPRPPGSPIGMIVMSGRARMVGQGNSMQDLADRLTGFLKRPVIDATALKAKYDFTLTFSPEGMNGPMGPMPTPPAPDPDALPDIFAAVQSQLGLKLEPRKVPVEMIVIDHIEKTPTEN